MRRCPACGASNPPDAAWCGQCYATLEPPAAPSRGPVADPEPPVALRPANPPAPVLPASDRRPAAAPVLRDGDAGLEWACPTCGSYSSLDETRCRVCATPFTAGFTSGAPATAPPSWSAALAVTAVAPGAGHIAARRTGTGLARLLLFFTWAAGGVFLLRGGGPSTAPAAAPLLLGAAVLWATSLLDVHRLSRGEPDLLGGRALLWLVVAVLGLTMAGVAATVAALRI